jgi:hypothetical protein
MLILLRSDTMNIPKKFYKISIKPLSEDEITKINDKRLHS